MSARGFANIVFVPSAIPDWGDETPTTMLLMTLRKGKGDAPDFIYGPRSRFFGPVDINDEAGLASYAQSNRGGAGWAPFHHGPNVSGRTRTTLSLAVKGSFILAIQLEGRLESRTSFNSRPFSMPDDVGDRFAMATTLQGQKVAYMAVRASDDGNPVPFNINLLVMGGKGSGDAVADQDHYAGVDCLTPIAIDPDVRWPDGIDPVGIPPPP